MPLSRMYAASVPASSPARSNLLAAVSRRPMTLPISMGEVVGGSWGFMPPPCVSISISLFSSSSRRSCVGSTLGICGKLWTGIVVISCFGCTVSTGCGCAGCTMPGIRPASTSAMYWSTLAMAETKSFEDWLSCCWLIWLSATRSSTVPICVTILPDSVASCCESSLFWSTIWSTCLPAATTSWVDFGGAGGGGLVTWSLESDCAVFCSGSSAGVVPVFSWACWSMALASSASAAATRWSASSFVCGGGASSVVVAVTPVLSSTAARWVSELWTSSVAFSVTFTTSCGAGAPSCLATTVSSLSSARSRRASARSRRAWATATSACASATAGDGASVLVSDATAAVLSSRTAVPANCVTVLETCSESAVVSSFSLFLLAAAAALVLATEELTCMELIVTLLELRITTRDRGVQVRSKPVGERPTVWRPAARCPASAAQGSVAPADA